MNIFSRQQILCVIEQEKYVCRIWASWMCMPFTLNNRNCHSPILSFIWFICALVSIFKKTTQIVTDDAHFSHWGLKFPFFIFFLFIWSIWTLHLQPKIFWSWAFSKQFFHFFERIWINEENIFSLLLSDYT